MSSSHDEILSRLALLERENTGFRIAGAFLSLFIITFLVMGAARPTPQTLTANEFILQDGQGRTRAKLSADSKRVSLLFLNESGRSEMSLTAQNDSRGLGHASLALGEGAVAARYVLVGTDSGDGAAISDGGVFLTGKGTNRIVLTASGVDSPGIEVADTDGYAVQIGVSRRVVPATGETQKSSAASLVLMGKDQDILWSAP
jgi:hypothetical protein